MNIKDKIAKVLALAESPNEYEARDALLKARKLMAKYKLREEDICLDEKIKVINRHVGITCSKRRDSWAVNLSAIVANHYCCKSYITRHYGKQTVEIGFIGFEDDIEICEQVFKYAHHFLNDECEKIGKEYREAFGMGFCAGLKEAFKKQGEENQEWGLVLVTPSEVQAEVDKIGKPKIFKKVELDSEKKQFANAGYDAGLRFDPSTKLPKA